MISRTQYPLIFNQIIRQIRARSVKKVMETMRECDISHLCIDCLEQATGRIMEDTTERLDTIEQFIDNITEPINHIMSITNTLTAYETAQANFKEFMTGMGNKNHLKTFIPKSEPL